MDLEMRVNSWRVWLGWEGRNKKHVCQILIVVTIGSCAPFIFGIPVARFSALKALRLKTPLFDRYFDRNPRAIFFLLTCAVTE